MLFFPTVPPGDIIPDAEDEEELLNHLFQFVQDNSPPPTNPPSPPEPEDESGDSETDHFDIDTFNNTNFINQTSCSSGSSSNSSTNGDGDSSPSYDDNFLSEGSSDDNSPLYEEGLIGEDLINEQPDIFDTPFGCLADSKLNIFGDDFEKEIKHDCMWFGETFSSRDNDDECNANKAQVPLLSKALPVEDKFDYTKIKIKIEPEDESMKIKEEILTEEDEEVKEL